MTTRARMAALIAALRDDLWTCEALAKRLHISRRTIWRDLAALVAAGVATNTAGAYRLAMPGERTAGEPPLPRKCRECSADVAPGRGRCSRHLALLRERYARSDRRMRAAERRRARKSDGLCRWCGLPTQTRPDGTHPTYCATHAKRDNAAKARREKIRRMRRRAGLD